MRLHLVHASRANIFMREILEAVAFEVERAGGLAWVVDDVFPADDDACFVVIPHEYFAVTPQQEWPTQEQLARTFALTVEHPGTPWFETSAQQARRCAAILDINRDSTAELRRRGLPADLFQLGYTEHVDRWHGDPVERPTDVLYLGSTDAKRDRLLASYAPHLWDRRSTFLIPGQEPRTGAAGDFLTGEPKLDLLATSRTLVNLHRDRSRALEWVRVLEAVANGCVVFSEHSVDASPLEAGRHFVSATGESLGLLVADALDDEPRLEDMRHQAYEFVRESLPLARAAELLLDRAEGLLRDPRPVPGRLEVPVLPLPAPRQVPWREPDRFDDDHLVHAVARIEQRLTTTAREVAELSERSDAARTGAGQSPAPSPETTPGFAEHSPRVSILVPAHNAALWIEECIESALASRDVALEILVQDDASTDPTAAAVRRAMRARPDAAIRLDLSLHNRGPAATRNALLARARGEFVFALDADNGVYPSALPALVTALEEDATAAFAYCILAVLRDGEPQGLLSNRAWTPGLFRYGNYIDNMALIRTAVLRDAGGWDERIQNWEDYQLWIRLAEAGHHAAFVPSILAWYRSSPHSVSWQSAPHRSRLWNGLRAVAPTIMDEGVAP